MQTDREDVVQKLMAENKMLKEKLREESDVCLTTSDILLRISSLERKKERLIKNITTQKRIISNAKIKMNSLKGELDAAEREIQNLKEERMDYR